MMRYIIWFVYSALIITFLHTSSESQYYLPLIMFFSSMFVWRLWWEESWWYLESSEGCWIYLPKSTSKQEQRLDQSWAESPGHHQNVEVRSCQRTRKYEEVVQGTRRKTLLNKIFCLQKDIWIEKCTVYPPRCLRCSPLCWYLLSSWEYPITRQLLAMMMLFHYSATIITTPHISTLH